MLPPVSYQPRKPSRRRARAAVVATPTPPPPPPPPPAAAVVVSAYAGGTTAVLVFDRPMEVTGSTPDDAVTFNGMTPVSVANADEVTLSFALPGFVSAGDPWVISRQPDWLITPVTWPADGVL